MSGLAGREVGSGLVHIHPLFADLLIPHSSETRPNQLKPVDVLHHAMIAAPKSSTKSQTRSRERTSKTDIQSRLGSIVVQVKASIALVRLVCLVLHHKTVVGI